MNSRQSFAVALNRSGLVFASALAVCFVTATADAAMIGGYAFDGDAGTSTPATVAEINGNTALDLGLGSSAEYNADTPFAYAGNTSLDVASGIQERANNDTTTAYQFANTAAWSVSAWVKTSTTGVTQTIVGQRDAHTLGNGWILSISSSGKAFLQVQGQSSPDGRVAISTASVNDGQWHHIVGVYDPNFDADGDIQLYVDGSPDGHDTKTQPNAILYNDSDFAVGVQRDTSGGNTNPLTGLIDEVALFNTALQQSDVTALFNNSITIPEPGSIGLLLLGVTALFRRRR